MKISLRAVVTGCFLILLILCGSVTAKAAWEIGSKAGFDSNIDRAIDGGKDDYYLSAYLSLSREPSDESRIDWSVTTTLEGTIFKNLSDLSYIEITIAPGVVYSPHRLWSVTLFPFLQAKGVSDSDQSSLAFGGKIGLRQQLRPDLYLGQYYLYKNSSAEVATYSFEENAVGLYAGVNWTSSIFSEVGYEYSHGDSFRSLSTTSTIANGKGRHQTFSSAFEEIVVQEPVDRNAVGVNIGVDWNKSFFSIISYTFTTIKGDLGSSISHSGFIGIGYKF